MILAIFYLQITLLLPTKFQVNWPFSSREVAKNRFSRWRHVGHLGFLIGMILAIFDLQVTLMLLVQEKKQKIDFQDGHHGGHPGFPTGTNLAILDLQVTPMLPIKFQNNWLFSSGEEANKRPTGHGSLT